MLQTEALSYFYNKENPLHFPDLKCERGEQLLLLGQSGCGKTTLLHLLGGLLLPKGGKISINNTDITKLSSTELDKFRGQEIGIIFQKAHFVNALTVEENLLLAQSLAGNNPDKNAVHGFLQKLNVFHKLHSKTSELSQGEQQRVAIARALVNRPSLILADEPTSALDDTNTKEVIELLEQQAKDSNACLLIVTHDGRLKERFSNRVELTRPNIEI